MGQHCTGQNPMQYCLRGSRQHCVKKNPVQFFFNAVQEVPDNIAEEKILCNVVLILLVQHYTGQNFMQCCPRCSRQHCIKKILCNVVVILLGQHCTRKTLCNVVWKHVYIINFLCLDIKMSINNFFKKHFFKISYISVSLFKNLLKTGSLKKVFEQTKI